MSGLRSCFFDHPSAIDWELLREVWSDLRQQMPTMVPSYDYATGLRGPTQWLTPSEFVILEGLWAFHDTHIFSALDLSIYVDTPPDIRLLRRLNRDVINGERGWWDIASFLTYYSGCQRALHDQFVEPGILNANVVVYGERAIHHSVETVLTALEEKVGYM